MSLRVEQQKGVWVVVDTTSGYVRPASTFEVEMWEKLNSPLQPLRESYIRINEADFLRIIVENDQLRMEVTKLKNQFAQIAKEKGHAVIELHDATKGSLPPAPSDK